MASSLLDFVMALVRDPEAGARYAADPAQAIADADLTDVTSADVQNLIPVVAESLSMATPSHGLDAFGVEAADNVWTSGAATSAFEAFDAFADHLPESVTMDTHTVATDVVDHIDTLPDALSDNDPDVLPGGDLLDTVDSLQLDDLAVQDPVTADPGLVDDWVTPVADPGATPDHGDPAPGFDVFD